MQATNAARAEKKERLRQIVTEAEEAGKNAALSEKVERYYLTSVNIKPATCDLVYWLKAEQYPVKTLPKGGGANLVPPATVPVFKQWAWAIAFAEILKKNGYKAVPVLIEMPGENGEFNGKQNDTTGSVGCR